ncbi:MAG: sensor histidine kinase [Lactobacillales bacterium]|jgi:signal transduction histidine kinase|nr:sensor histidine kinase [Lactobacillales bacterium]
MLNSFFNFLKDYRWYYGTIVFSNVCFLYSVVMHNFSLEVFLDTLVFEVFFVVVVTIVIYSHWRKRKKLLADFYDIETTLLPQTNEIERKYAELVFRLKKEIFTIGNNHLLKEQEMLNYYAMWTHQLKIPLSVLDLMIQTENLEVESFKEELLKIEQYLDMMLQYLRLNTSTTDYQLVKIDVELLVKEILKKYRYFFIQKNLAVTVSSLKLTVVTDKKWLTFVLEQVLSNAIKYTKQGSVNIYFEKSVLVIEDTGIGISKEDLPRIFEQGYTGYNGRIEEKASGLGLFMVKQILNELGHEIEIQSTIGIGTLVRINFSQKEFKNLE